MIVMQLRSSLLNARPLLSPFKALTGAHLYYTTGLKSNIHQRQSLIRHIQQNPGLLRSSIYQHVRQQHHPQQPSSYSPILSLIKRNYSTQQKEDTHHHNTHQTTHSEEAKSSDTMPKRSVFSDLKKLAQLARRDVRLLALAILLLLASCSINMLMPRAYGMVLDAAKNVYNGEIPNVAFGLSLHEFIGFMGLFLFLGIAADYGRIILLRILGEKLVARLRSNVIKKTMSQDAEFFDIHKVGDLISRLGSDAYVVSRAMTQNISDGAKHFINGSISIASMFYLSSHLASTVFIFLPGILIGTILFGNRVRTISRGIQEATGNLTKVGEEQLSGIKTVQSFVAEGKELRKYNGAIRNVFALGFKEAKLNATFYSGIYAISDITFLAVLTYGAHLVADGALSIGDLAAFMLYVNHSGTAMYGLASFYSELMKGTGAASRLFELIDRKPKIESTTGKLLLQKPVGHIQVKDLTFSYPTRPKLTIFKDLNFDIPAGSNVCIVGPSGRGKSTITSLLLRYYDPLSGQILLDGHDISEYNVKSLRRHLGVVQQEPILMSGTIRDNIAFGLKSYNVPEDKIIEAAKMANCHEFISKFPDGYDTIIGPRGALLSGGQKQRISIARALIKEPSVLILDEATSALDTKSEYAINLTLQRLMRGGNFTTISIAHRLSTIEKADTVIVFGYDGKVAEQGGFHELYSNKNSALYKLMHEGKSGDHKHKKPDDSKPVEDFEDDEETKEFIRKELAKGLDHLETDVHKKLEEAEKVEPAPQSKETVLTK